MSRCCFRLNSHYRSNPPLTALSKIRGPFQLAGSDAPDHEVSKDTPLVIDLDATLITAHSKKLVRTGLAQIRG